MRVARQHQSTWSSPPLLRVRDILNQLPGRSRFGMSWETAKPDWNEFERDEEEEDHV